MLVPVLPLSLVLSFKMALDSLVKEVPRWLLATVVRRLWLDDVTSCTVMIGVLTLTLVVLGRSCSLSSGR